MEARRQAEQTNHAAFLGRENAYYLLTRHPRSENRRLQGRIDAGPYYDISELEAPNLANPLEIDAGC